MIINSQLPLIYTPGRHVAPPAESAVNGSTPASQNQFITRQVQPTTWAENLNRARNYTLNAQDINEPLNQLGKEAVSAYTSHDQRSERDYLAEVFGIDTYA